MPQDELAVLKNARFSTRQTRAPSHTDTTLQHAELLVGRGLASAFLKFQNRDYTDTSVGVVTPPIVEF